MLSIVYAHEHGHGFNPLPAPLERSYYAARRAVDLAPGNYLAHQAMSTVLLFRKEITASLHEADRAVALNPLDGAMSPWARTSPLPATGTRLRAHRAGDGFAARNIPHVRGMPSFKEYCAGNYSAADIEEALKTNAPYLFWLQIVLAASCGQLGDREAASSAVTALTAQVPDFSPNAMRILGTWLQPALVAHLIEGLQKAGMPIDET